MKRRLAKRQEAAQHAAQLEETLRTKLLKDRNGARYWALPQVSAAPAEATTEAAALAPSESCVPAIPRRRTTRTATPTSCCKTRCRPRLPARLRHIPHSF